MPSRTTIIMAVTSAVMLFMASSLNVASASHLSGSVSVQSNNVNAPSIPNKMFPQVKAHAEAQDINGQPRPGWWETKRKQMEDMQNNVAYNTGDGEVMTNDRFKFNPRLN